MPSLIPSSPPTEPPLPPTPLHEQVEALSLVNAYLQKQITDAAHLDEKQAAAKNRLAARLAARKGGKAAGLVSSGGGDGENVGRMAALAAESTRLIEGGEYRKALGVLVVAFKIIEKKYYVKEKKDGGAPDFGEDKVSSRGEGAGTGQGAARRSEVLCFYSNLFAPLQPYQKPHVQKLHDNVNLYTAWRQAEDEKNEREYIKRYEGDLDSNFVGVAETAPEFVRTFVPVIGSLRGLEEFKEVSGKGGLERRSGGAEEMEERSDDSSIGTFSQLSLSQQASHTNPLEPPTHRRIPSFCA